MKRGNSMGQYSSNVVVSKNLAGSFLIELVDFCNKEEINGGHFFMKRIDGKGGSVCTNLNCMSNLNIQAGEVVLIRVSCETDEKAESICRKIIRFLEGKESLNEANIVDDSKLSKFVLVSNLLISCVKSKFNFFRFVSDAPHLSKLF